MLRGLYTAYTGMNAQQQRMDTISNNLANVNTTGYKKDGVFFESFKDLYINKINDPESNTSKRIGKMNFGVRVGETYVDYSQGTLQQTNIANQIGIQGDGFFVVGTLNEDGSYNEKYTRDGSFTLNNMGQLVTLDGQFVMGEDGPIVIEDMQNLIVNELGGVYEGPTKIGQLKLVGIKDPTQLNKIGNGLYVRTTESVEIDFTGKVQQGFLENSNVSSIEEMINMINVMRSYESSQKILTTYDATLDQAVNQIGRL